MKHKIHYMFVITLSFVPLVIVIVCISLSLGGTD